MKIVLTTLNAKYSHTSLALRYLKAYADERTGQSADVEWKEFTINNQLLDILGQLMETKPAVIGFVCYIWNIEMTRQLIDMIHQVMPECIIVCGGPEVSYETEKFMQDNPSVSYVVRGEGEVVFAELIDYLNGTAPAPEAVAYWYNGKIISGRAVVIDELNTIPFPYKKDEMPEIKEKIIYYESSRGCPFSCKYCLSSATRGVRFLSTERVMNELQFFIDNNVRQVKFVDRTFNAQKSHYLPILKFIAAQNCRTNFHFEIAVDILDEEVMTALEAMPKGRIQLEIGVQSTFELTLAAVQRKNNWAKIAEYVKRIVDFDNMHVHLDLIIGLPYEDYQTFGRSFNDVYGLRPHMLQVGFLKMLKGSAIAAMAEEHEYKFMKTAPYQVLSNKYMSYSEMWRLHIFEDVVEQFYNSGRFRNTTDYIIEKLYDNNAFRFYEQLTIFWHDNNCHLAAHSPKNLYSHLVDFIKQYFPAYNKVIDNLLRLDALTSDNGKIRSEVLNWNNDKYMKETSKVLGTNIINKYIRDYKFTNWRDVRKRCHIEVFDFVPDQLKCGNTNEKMTPILFEPHSENKYIVIKKNDFWQGE